MEPMAKSMNDETAAAHVRADDMSGEARARADEMGAAHTKG